MNLEHEAAQFMLYFISRMGALGSQNVLVPGSPQVPSRTCPKGVPIHLFEARVVATTQFEVDEAKGASGIDLVPTSLAQAVILLEVLTRVALP